MAKSRKGNAVLYAIPIILVVLALILTIPVLPTQNIEFSLEDGNVQDANYVSGRQSITTSVLDQLEGQTVSNAKVELKVYNETQRECLNDRFRSEECPSAVNQTIWTTPTADISAKVNLEKGEYLASITSYIYDEPQDEMVEEDSQEITFAVE